MSEPDWESLARMLYPVAVTAGCRCEYERNGAGVPTWYPTEVGVIERRLVQRCSKCLAVDAYKAAVNP